MARTLRPMKRSTISHKNNGVIDRQIFALALPVLGTLIAEPLLTMADSAMIGHVGTAELGGLGTGSAILNFVVGMCIFVQYTTTSVAGKRLGMGDRAGAIGCGIQGMWMAASIGVVLSIAVWYFAPSLTRIMGAKGDVAQQSIIYLHYSSPGLVFMLVFLSANGAMRGLMNTQIPFIVSTIGTFANIPLNAFFIYGLHLGVAGAGLGTVIAQAFMSIVLFSFIAKAAYHYSVPIRPILRQIIHSGLQGAPLVIRTLSLQLGVMTTVWIAISMGKHILGAHQIVRSIYFFTVFSMDALAIAAQALIANAIGAGDRQKVRSVISRCIFWGTISGAALMLILVSLSAVLPHLFTTDAAVLDTAWIGLIACAVWLPLSGAVFMYDGILIGAGDVRYLAFSQLIVPLIYLPVAFSMRYLFGGGALGLVLLWCGYGCVFMGVRLITLVLRARSDEWIIKAENKI
ncbi:MAG: MATE family efflux transporter [Actinomycetaceae bacterium]|nr:MATE family efflux transporter [Actinomycetaceae bacterium]